MRLVSLTCSYISMVSKIVWEAPVSRLMTRSGELSLYWNKMNILLEPASAISSSLGKRARFMLQIGRYCLSSFYFTRSIVQCHYLSSFYMNIISFDMIRPYIWWLKGMVKMMHLYKLSISTIDSFCIEAIKVPHGDFFIEYDLSAVTISHF